MENWKLLLAGIRNALKETFNIRGSVEVSNLPEVQHVVIDNPQEPTETVQVSNLIDYKEELTKIIGELIKVPKDIKTADYSPIINALKEVVRTLEVDRTDYSPIILAIESAVKELKVTYPEFDDSQIVKAIKEIQIPKLDFEKYLYNGEVPVILNTEQLKKLVKAFGKQVGSTVVSMGGGSSTTRPTYIAATPYKLVSAASTNATSLKASAGVIYGIQLTNVNASPRYLKLYNKASAPTVGTDTPVKTLIIPGNATGAGSNVPIPVRGINFSIGIAFALTTEAADSGTTGVAANEIIVNIDYI